MIQSNQLTSNSSKLPKIIHYCWFGNGNMPSLSIMCMQSWKKYCPDYKIVRWDESNFDINSNLYIKQAYESKKYAFVSDYARLYILYNYGGIYMDTDVEVIKNLDQFLDHQVFSGFESENYVPTGIIGANKYHSLIKDLMDIYQGLSFIKADNTMDLTPNVVRITQYMINKYNLLTNNKLQILDNDVHIYPNNYFCPKTFTGINITNNTYTIHHFAGSWLTSRAKLEKHFKEIILGLLGANNYNRLKKFKYEVSKK